MVKTISRNNAKTIAMAYKRAAKNIHKEANNSLAATGRFMLTTALSLVPRYTGETARGLRTKQTKRKIELISTVRPKGSSGFMQNFWSNQTAPWRTVNMWWNKESNKTVYGDGSHRTTGTPRWFHFTNLRARKFWDKTINSGNSKALKSAGFR